MEPPGRAARLKEPQLPDLQRLAAALLPVVASRLHGGPPYVVVAHSLGTWAAFELLRLAKRQGLPMPAAAWLSAMPSPDTPLEQRPWRQQRALDEQQFVVGGCMGCVSWLSSAGMATARSAAARRPAQGARARAAETRPDLTWPGLA